eukprot:Colp12_sorted_trinity150504_noHs@17765
MHTIEPFHIQQRGLHSDRRRLARRHRLLVLDRLKASIQPPSLLITIALDVHGATELKVVFSRVANDLEHVLRNLDALSLTRRLHLGTKVDGRPEQTETWHLNTDDTSHCLPRVQTDTQLKFLLRHVRNAARVDGITKIKTNVRNFESVAITIPYRHTGHNHVGVTDGLDLVDVVVIEDRIELGVKTVEQLDDLHRGTATSNCCEADDIGEVDTSAVVLFSLDLLALLEIVGDRLRKKFVQELLSLLLLNFELLCALVHHLLKTRRVLLKHTDDAVDQVARLGIKGCDLSNDRFKARANGGIFVPAFLHQLPVTMGAIVRYFRAEVALLDLCDDVNRLQVVCHVRKFTRQQLPHNDTKAIHVGNSVALAVEISGGSVESCGLGRCMAAQDLGGGPQETSIEFVVGGFILYCPRTERGATEICQLHSPAVVNETV